MGVFSLQEELARYWSKVAAKESQVSADPATAEDGTSMDEPTDEESCLRDLGAPKQHLDEAEDGELSQSVHEEESEDEAEEESKECAHSEEPQPSPATPATRSPATRSPSRRSPSRRSPSRRSRSRRARLQGRGRRPPRRYEWAGTRAELGLPPRRGSRSRSRARRSRSRRSWSRRSRRRSRRSMSPAKTRRSKWDVRPDPSDPDQNLLSQRGLMDSVVAGGKKRRECYVGNLPQHQVDDRMLKETFNRLFNSLPSFVERYPDVVDTVRSVFFPPKSDGMFAFVEFVDDVLTTTAIAMSGFELLGRAVRVGRPQHYLAPPNGELPALDLQALRENGILPEEDCGKVQVSNVMREVYFGNLNPGMVDEEVMRELLEPAMHELPEYSGEGPAITKVNLVAPGKFCFVQFQNAELATRAIAIFDDTELFGRRLKASRPSKYAMTVEPPTATAAAVVLPPPPAPLAPQLLQVAAKELAAEQTRALTAS